MQIWFEGPRTRHDGEYTVSLNPRHKGRRPFAIIGLDRETYTERTALLVENLEEADRLIRAAIEAKRLLAEAIAATDGEA